MLILFIVFHFFKAVLFKFKYTVLIIYKKIIKESLIKLYSFVKLKIKNKKSNLNRKFIILKLHYKK